MRREVEKENQQAACSSDVGNSCFLRQNLGKTEINKG